MTNYSGEIAFLGQGRMGVPMAKRLAAAGPAVTTWRRGNGVPVAEAVADAGVVITMLRDGHAVLDVLRDALPGLRPDAIVIDMSTIGPEAVARVRALLPDSVDLVDAPVLGSVGPAADGTLTVLASGAVDRCRDLLSVFGTVREYGALGTAAALKLAVMSTIVPVQVLVAESLAYGEAHGVPRADVLDVLAGTPLGGMAERLREPAEETRYALGLAAKDLALAAWQGATLATAARLRLQDAEAAGYGDRDLTTIAHHVAGDAGESSGRLAASGDRADQPGRGRPATSGDQVDQPGRGRPATSGDQVDQPGQGSAAGERAGRVTPVNPPTVPATNGMYSHAVRAGDTLYISGQAAFDDNGQVVAPGDMRAQAEHVFQCLERILADQGASFADVAFIRSYLTDMSQAPAYREVRRRHITGTPPASTTVEVSRLFMPGLVLEVDAIVSLPS
ncbi:Rid family hydrolase [Nonomuraea typhae]|uniref:Rid family hydrolase n=1 Tax=Nonomuraea typhae TaxID=2603600 RepID=A0ABW7YKC2_9ACTN